MSVFNRSFLALLALAWCTALALGAYLIWDQSRNVNFDGSWLQLHLDLIFGTQAERILATIAAAALALPALLLLAMELTPSGARYSGSDRRRDESYGALLAKVDTLQKRLDDEQSRRRQAEKDFGRERAVARDDSRRNLEAVRSTAGQPAATEGRPPPRRRGWHLLPRRS